MVLVEALNAALRALSDALHAPDPDATSSKGCFAEVLGHCALPFLARFQFEIHVGPSCAAWDGVRAGAER